MARTIACRGAEQVREQTVRPQRGRRVADVLDAPVGRAGPRAHAALEVEEVGHVLGGRARSETLLDPAADLPADRGAAVLR